MTREKGDEELRIGIHEHRKESGFGGKRVREWEMVKDNREEKISVRKKERERALRSRPRKKKRGQSVTKP